MEDVGYDCSDEGSKCGVYLEQGDQGSSLFDKVRMEGE